MAIAKIHNVDITGDNSSVISNYIVSLIWETIMKLKDKYQQLKKMHPDIMIILLSGSFYVSYGMDALLLAHLFSYHIKDDKVGFQM